MPITRRFRPSPFYSHATSMGSQTTSRSSSGHSLSRSFSKNCDGSRFSKKSSRASFKSRVCSLLSLTVRNRDRVDESRGENDGFRFSLGSSLTEKDIVTAVDVAGNAGFMY